MSFLIISLFFLWLFAPLSVYQEVLYRRWRKRELPEFTLKRSRWNFYLFYRHEWSARPYGDHVKFWTFQFFWFLIFLPLFIELLKLAPYFGNQMGGPS